VLPASNKGVGMNIGFPDVCLTPAPPAPPVPVPYPNLALNAQAAPFSLTVKVSMVNALNMGSEIPLTSGDEPGIANPTIKGPGRYTMGNPVVMVEALPAINLTCPTNGNNMNNPLGAVLVPSITNVFFGDRAQPAPPLGAPRSVDLAAVTRLAGSIAPSGPVSGTTQPGGVACLAVPVFSSDVSARVYSAVGRPGGGRVTALVLDLRGCPGGDVDACLRLAGDFLDRGSMIATMIDPDGDAIVHRARHGDPYTFPLFLLVDRLTASAAELFAGSLQQNGRAVVVGERTYGKGTAQTLLPGFAEPSACYATVATFTLPNGEPIEGRGIYPDVEVPADAALDAALTMITSPQPRARCADAASR
jgi:carboxyl-terminal processing protease